MRNANLVRIDKIPNLFHHVGHGLIITMMPGVLKLTSSSSTNGRRAISVFSHAAVASQASPPTISLSPFGQDMLTPSQKRRRQHHYQQHPIGRFGRKASKIGHHIEKAEELAHRTERQDARNTRHKKECATWANNNCYY